MSSYMHRDTVTQVVVSVGGKWMGRVDGRSWGKS